jgi:hypothetical protein
MEAWMWIGARAYNATGSLLADMGVAFLGFVATIVVVMKGLHQMDKACVALRRRAGHDQREGALSQVVVASATLGLGGFLPWYYILERAFVIPFMPSH